MRAVDTNVLVRVVTRDDEKQVESADAFVERGAWISHLVLAETIWVLRGTFEFDHARAATVIEMLLSHRSFTLQDADVVASALEHYRRKPKIGFSDCLILEIARKAGHLPLGTFDNNLSKIEGAERL
jgi:predicted nucleic-acid-binding protein